MTDALRKTEEKSASGQAFEHYLRTGQRLTASEFDSLQERKYNQNHDELGRFTFAWNNAGGHRTSDRNPGPVARPSPRGAVRQPVGAARSSDPIPFKQVGSHPARVYRTKGGAAIIDPRSGAPMLVPQGVSLANTVRVARIFSSPLNRDAAAATAFAPDGPMDLQRTYSTLRNKDGKRLIDQRFVAIGNYNFGVYAAASGMSLKKALAGAATVYAAQTLKLGGNARNESLIVSGYRDFFNGSIGN